MAVGLPLAIALRRTRRVAPSSQPGALGARVLAAREPKLMRAATRLAAARTGRRSVAARDARMPSPAPAPVWEMPAISSGTPLGAPPAPLREPPAPLGAPGVAEAAPSAPASREPELARSAPARQTAPEMARPAPSPTRRAVVSRAKAPTPSAEAPGPAEPAAVAPPTPESLGLSPAGFEWVFGDPEKALAHPDVTPGPAVSLPPHPERERIARLAARGGSAYGRGARIFEGAAPNGGSEAATDVGAPHRDSADRPSPVSAQPEPPVAAAPRRRRLARATAETLTPAPTPAPDPEAPRAAASAANEPPASVADISPANDPPRPGATRRRLARAPVRSVARTEAATPGTPAATDARPSVEAPKTAPLPHAAATDARPSVGERPPIGPSPVALERATATVLRRAMPVRRATATPVARAAVTPVARATNIPGQPATATPVARARVARSPRPAPEPEPVPAPAPAPDTAAVPAESAPHVGRQPSLLRRVMRALRGTPPPAPASADTAKQPDADPPVRIPAAKVQSLSRMSQRSQAVLTPPRARVAAQPSPPPAAAQPSPPPAAAQPSPPPAAAQPPPASAPLARKPAVDGGAARHRQRQATEPPAGAFALPGFTDDQSAASVLELAWPTGDQPSQHRSADGDDAHLEILARIREEQEQLGRLIRHPF